MSKVIMCNDSFYGCLSEPQGVSARWKETAQTRIFLLSRSLLLNHLQAQSTKTKLVLLIMPIDIVAYAFTLFWDNLCRNSCIHVFLPHLMDSSLLSWIFLEYDFNKECLLAVFGALIGSSLSLVQTFHCEFKFGTKHTSFRKFSLQIESVMSFVFSP